MSAELILLVQALVILVVPVALWRFLGLRHGMPLVCVQIVVGIALGPSVFGRIAPDLYGLFFTPATLTPLSGIAAIAVVLFGYITGLHLEPATIVRRGRAFAFVASASVAVPTAAGFLGGLWIAGQHPAELGERADAIGFATAVGICVGLTALPVLGAILREMDLLGHRIGDLALGIAAVNDAALWLLLGALMAVLAGESSGQAMLISLFGTPVYLIVMFRYVRPYLQRLAPILLRNGRMSERGLAAVCGVALGSAVVTQLLGLHYVFGAFVAGALMPQELRQLILDRLQLVVIGILMPFFFMITGLRTYIDLGSLGFLQIMLVTTGIAVGGKIGGTMLAARLTGERWSNAFTLGALLQPSGLMALIVLTVLLERGVISTNAFSALTLTAVFTTLLAMPLARIGLRWSARESAFAPTPPILPGSRADPAALRGSAAVD
jgi:Kef-type K+ transport system membrane component KefB